MIPTALVVLFIVVSLTRLLPGNIVDLMLSESSVPAGQTAVARLKIEQQLGLDKSLPEQYGRYVLNVARGDLGHSLWSGHSVGEELLSRASVTAEVAVIAILVSVAVAIPLGTFSAVRQDTKLDYFLRSGSIAGISLPSFVVAQAIIILPALWWQKSLPFQYASLAENPIQNLTIVIPAAGVLGLRLSASVTRMMRTTMLDVMQQDYIRTARAKGLANLTVIMGHGVKNALIPVVTLLGLEMAALVGGSVITESLFALPGVGRLLLDSIRQRDYPLIQGVVVSVSFLVMLTNLAVDMSYGFLDPRIRYS